MASKWLICSAILALAVVAADAQLDESFYATSCPQAVQEIQSVITQFIARDRNLAPSLLRLHFHDCFVRGCDASVLLDSTPTTPSEKEGMGNKDSLRGFEVIDAAKAAVEALCPGVVSCSDILALAARDAMVAFAGSVCNWTVPLGRRDGVLSFDWEANANLPPPFADYNTLVSIFANKGLTDKEMVVLSGSHTVGRARCSLIQQRIYNFSDTVPTDPALDPWFANSLKRQCRFGDNSTLIKMDQSKYRDTWDFNYFSNSLRGRVLFSSDDAVKRNRMGMRYVQLMKKANSIFNSAFAAAIVKMGQIEVITGTQGQIRSQCRVVNTA